MKFLVIATLAIVSALEDGETCDAEPTGCAEGSCCGTATMDQMDTITVCSDSTSTNFSNGDGDWEFKCNTAVAAEGATEEGSASLALSAVALLTAAYTLA